MTNTEQLENTGEELLVECLNDGSKHIDLGYEYTFVFKNREDQIEISSGNFHFLVTVLEKHITDDKSCNILITKRSTGVFATFPRSIIDSVLDVTNGSQKSRIDQLEKKVAFLEKQQKGASCEN